MVMMVESDFVLELSKEAFLVGLSRFRMMMEGDCVLELRKEAFLLGVLFVFFSCIEED